MDFEQNVERDALLVSAAMAGGIMQAAIGLGMTTSDVHAHGEWLRAQPKAYINRVVKRIVKAERPAAARAAAPAHEKEG